MIPPPWKERIGTMRTLPLLIASGTLALAGSFASAQQTAACESLAKFQVPNAAIASATAIAAGEFPSQPNPYTGEDMSAFYKQLPAFCRVVVQAHPSSDSNIAIEVWLPLSGWNGKLQGIGNGGFAGQINFMELAASIVHGYAVAGTDTGHAGTVTDAAWALGHPEKIADFGYRGIHEMTRVARLVIAQFYGSPATHAYFAGCSDGGREALMEAQRYPADYDGILAGAPANYWTGLLSLAAFNVQALTATPASFIPPAKIAAIAAAVNAACDKLDGVTDGILNDPRQCRFDPATIQCEPGQDNDKCLTPPQVAALKTIYRGLRGSGDRLLFPGFLPGAEDGGGGWTTWVTGPAPGRSLEAAFTFNYFSYMVYNNKDWDVKSFTVDAGLQTAQSKTAGILDAVNPDLSAFRAHGGKLILYHGWDDPAIPALNTVNYYGQVIGKMGSAGADSFVRLYMFPGVQHCSGGPGPDTIGQSATWPLVDPEHNVRIALENWVEKGTAPSTLIVSKVSAVSAQSAPAVTITRPLCPYPQSARYKGTGDPNSAASFACAAPAK